MSTFNRWEEFDFNGTTITLDASAADAYTWKPVNPCIVLGAKVTYTEATDAAIATPGVVSIDHTPSGGSRTEKGLYTAQVSKAIGEEEEFSSFTQFKVKDGDSVILEHKTQQGDAEDGAVIVTVYYYSVPDGAN